MILLIYIIKTTIITTFLGERLLILENCSLERLFEGERLLIFGKLFPGTIISEERLIERLEYAVSEVWKIIFFFQDGKHLNYFHIQDNFRIWNCVVSLVDIHMQLVSLFHRAKLLRDLTLMLVGTCRTNKNHASYVMAK